MSFPLSRWKLNNDFFNNDQLLNFGTPLISLERLKIETSNFTFYKFCILIVRDNERKNEKLAKMGVLYCIV